MKTQKQKDRAVRKTVTLPNSLWKKVENEADTLLKTQTAVIRCALEIYFREKEKDSE